MAEGKTRLVRFWPCACLGSPSGISGEHQSEITRKIDLKKIQATPTSTKTRSLLLHRSTTPATTVTGTTTTAAANISNKHLGHASRQLELRNSSEEGGYIQAISPTPSSAQCRQGSPRHQRPETREVRAPISPSSRAAASPFSPPAGCAVEIERNNKQPKIRLRDSWDGLVVLHSPKNDEGEEEEEQGEEQGDRVGTTTNQAALDNNNNTSNAINHSGSPRLLNHHYHDTNHNHNPNPNPPSQDDQNASSVTAVTSGVHEADAQLEGPLTTPQSLLNEISRLIAINDHQHVISALVVLTQGIQHHKHRLDSCLEELLAVVTACLQSKDDMVVSNALHAATELVRMYGDSLLQHMVSQQRHQEQHHPHQQQNNIFLLQLLICASRPSTSPIKTNADILLKHIASEMHQSTIVKLLEPLAARSGSSDFSWATAQENSIQSKAASTLLIATYRVS